MRTSRKDSKGTRIQARRPRDLDQAWIQYYAQLAGHFATLVRGRKLRVVLEAGCGKGQLTMPLLRLLPRVQMIAVDSSRGPYVGWLDDLKEKVKNERLGKRVRVIKADVREMRGVSDHSVDLVVSNELLCDLPYDRMLDGALREFGRILRPDGFMVHGEWSSFPTAQPQAFLVKHWPSWSPDQLFPMMRRHGFHGFEVSYFDTTIHFGYENAVDELRSWGANNQFLKRHSKVLRQEGLDLPFEHVIRCEK